MRYHENYSLPYASIANVAFFLPLYHFKNLQDLWFCQKGEKFDEIAGHISKITETVR